MKLFQVLDADREMFVVATDWAAALEAWRNQVVSEDDLSEIVEEISVPEPEGIILICGSDDLLIPAQDFGA